MGKKQTITLYSWWDIYEDEVIAIGTKALKTFIQCAASAGLLGAFLGGDYVGVRTALLSAGAALISTAWNSLLLWANR